MKRILTLIVAIAITGCGSVKLDGLGSYRPSLFRKDIDEFTFTRNVTTNGTNVVLKLKGYRGGAEALAGAVASGVAQGLSPK